MEFTDDEQPWRPAKENAMSSSPIPPSSSRRRIACLEGGLIALRTAGQINGAVQRATRTRRRIGPARPGRKNDRQPEMTEAK